MLGPERPRSAPNVIPQVTPKWPQIDLRVTSEWPQSDPKNDLVVETFVDFHWGAQNAWKSWKTRFYVFCLFTPLFRRFRLSRAWHAQDLDEIYRLVSKILNFTPCGSVFDRFCVLWENIDENLLKTQWNSDENLLKIYWKSSENTKTIEYRATWREI